LNFASLVATSGWLPEVPTLSSVRLRLPNW
jgi:hypothetical protein